MDRGWPNLSDGGAAVEGERAQGGRRKYEKDEGGKRETRTEPVVCLHCWCTSPHLEARTSSRNAQNRCCSGDSVLEVDLLVFPMLAVPTRPRRGDHDPDLDQGWPDLSNE
jgi:hypothetical protein